MIDKKYKELFKLPSDVNLCFPLIKKSVEKGDIVVELGVRDCVSTWALLAGRPSHLVSVDVVQPPDETIIEVGTAAKAEGIKFEFVQGDSTQVFFPVMDVLYVDTLHLYSHIVKELWRHAGQVRKRIIFHDTCIPEVRSCVQDFLYNLSWEVEHITNDCNGMIVLKRV